MFLLWWPTSRSHHSRDMCVQFLVGQRLGPTSCLSRVYVLTLELVPSNCIACFIEVLPAQEYQEQGRQSCWNLPNLSGVQVRLLRTTRLHRGHRTKENHSET